MRNNLQYGGLESSAHWSLRKHSQIDKTQANGEKKRQKRWATSVSWGQKNSDAYSFDTAFGTVVLAQSIPEGGQPSVVLENDNEM